MPNFAFQRLCIFASCVLISFCLSTDVTKAQDVLRIGYFDIPPHVIRVENEAPKGAAISYFEEFIAQKLDVSIVWDKQVTPPTRLMNQLGTGDKDAMIFLGYTEERTKFLHYPNPYLIIPEMLAFRQDHPLNKINSISDLHGLTIGFLVGGRIPPALQDEKMKYDLIAGKRLFERNVEKLMIKRVDAVYAPLSTALVEIIRKMDVEKQVKLISIDFLEPVKIYTVFSKKTVKKDFVEKYNNALDLAAKDQEYAHFLKTYLKRTGSN